MPKLHFTIPEQFQEPSDLGLDPRREGIQRWLADLPLMNLDHSVDALLEMLRRMNSARLNAGQRHELLNALATTVSEVGDALRDRFVRTLLPLPKRARAHFKNACELHRQLALGYKILFTGLLAQNAERNTPVLAESVYACVQQLTLLFVESYLIYAPAPEGLWHTLHGMFHLAEKRGFADRAIRKGEPNATVTALYKQAVLLALANPLRLMPGEAFTVYRLLHKWSSGCQLTLEPPQSGFAYFVADLESDDAPRFVPTGNHVTAVLPRFVSCTRLVTSIDRRIDELDDPDNESTRSLSRFARHMQRDMLSRLRSSWGRSSEREHPRSTKLGALTVATGLSATHYFCTGGKAFTPELEEIRIHTGRTPRGATDPGLSLLPLDLEPWAEEAELRLEAGSSEPRRSEFDNDSRALDVWEKIYATRVKQDADVADSDGTLKPLYASTVWECKNQSDGGLCLEFCAQRSMPLKVGDIVGYREDSKGTSSWIVASVRWLRIEDDGNMRMGIMQLSPDARGIATRAIVGVGKGGEYFRSLVVPNVPLESGQATLIVPATLYEQGTILAINDEGAIHYVRLQERLESSTSFSRFRFQTVPIPASENKNISELRKIV